MRLIRTFSEVPPSLQGGVIALGNFDGLHRGHQTVIRTALNSGRAAGKPAGVMTFEPHPRQFFDPETPPFRLSPFRIKARLIEAMGVDFLYSQTFDRAFALRSAEDFVTEILVGGLRIAEVVVGFDYVFGHERRGNVDLLREMAKQFGFRVQALPELKEDGGPRYSSSNIRAFLRQGQCEEASHLLGRYWEIEGRVEHGDKRGRALGFPTANLLAGEYLQPPKGIYAVRAGIDNGDATVWHDGVASFGNRPTFGKTDVVLEVYLFDFDGDLYGHHLRVALIHYIRPELKFEGVDALVAEMKRDSEKARHILATRQLKPGPAPFVAVA